MRENVQHAWIFSAVVCETLTVTFNTTYNIQQQMSVVMGGGEQTWHTSPRQKQVVFPCGFMRMVLLPNGPAQNKIFKKLLRDQFW